MTSKNVSKNNVHISTREITSKKVRGNNADFSTIEITSKRARGNNVDFKTIEIASEKVSGNDMDFSTIEITSKEYSGKSWKFVEILSLTYQRNIHVDSLGLYHFKLIHYRFLLNILLYYLIRSFSEMFFVSVFFGKTGYRGPLLLERTISSSSELEEVAIHRCSRTF